MKAATIPVQKPRAVLKEWMESLDSLSDQVTSWVQVVPGWRVVRSPKEIAEKRYGTYTVEVLTIEDEDGRQVRLEPIARDTLGGQGSVELYAWPTLYRVHLLPSAGGAAWDVLTDSGIKLRQPWDCDSFITLAQDLMAA